MNRAALVELNSLVLPIKGAPRTATINAGDVGANGALAGTQIQRSTQLTGCRTAVIAVPFRITQAAGKSVTVKAKLQTRDTTSGPGSTWRDLKSSEGGSTGTKTVSTTGAVDSIVVAGVSLLGCGDFIRTVVTPTFNATTTGPLLDVDAPVVIMGGAEKNPAQGSQHLAQGG